MKIRTQLYLSMIVFGIALVIIAASVLSITAQLQQLDRQGDLADAIGLGAADLNYLANEYLLYGEPQQIDRWNWRYSTFSDDLSNLSGVTPEQESLVTTIVGDQHRLKAVFDDIVVSGRGSPSTPLDPASLQISWSRLGVQTQGLVYDASRLSALLDDEKDGLQFLNSLLIAALLGTFSVFLLTSYLVVNRRTLQSIAALQAGAAVIGSGDLDHVIPVISDDEIGELAGAFNRMAADLQTVTASRTELERVMAERARFAREAVTERNRLAAILDAIPDAIGIYGPDGRYLYANPTLAASIGARPGDLVGRAWNELGLDLERIGPLIAAVEGAFAFGEIRMGVYDLPVDGTSRAYHAVAMPIRDENDRVAQVLVSSRDITELRDAEDTLRRYSADLERSNEELQRFAYVASHDLQEPLRSIVSFSQLLERRYKGKLDTDADEYIAFIVEGGRRMQQLILDLLQFSRIETAAKPMAAANANLTVTAAVRSLDTTLREAGATVTVDDLPIVMADAAQLEQVFTNLIGNAVKYGRDSVPPEVRISARPAADGMWEFAVADNGIGIEAEYYDRIFEMFRRLHTHDKYGGTGIGLAVVKRIVERHGGTIRVESTPGEGSIFYFTLPGA